MTPEIPPAEAATPRSTPDVSPALRALLAEIVDYAGLFPPAALPLDDALRRYAAYRQSAEAWMLARFVLPVARLDALSSYADLFAHDPPFRFAVLGTGGEDTRSFVKSLLADLDAVGAFLARHPGRVAADVMEVRLPAALLAGDGPDAASFLAAVADRIGASALPRLDVFFEVPLVPAPPDGLPALLDALAERRGAAAHHEAGLKIRTGGLEPDAFPDAGAIAAAVAGCRDRGVRFKATAGLHHPVRRYHASVGAHMYGFLNVFGAAVLAHAHGLAEADLRAILLDEAPDAFRFDRDGFAWRNVTAAPDAVRRARADLAVSFGSCSFDEPREDLSELGLL